MRYRTQGMLSVAVLLGSAVCTLADVYTDGKLTVEWTRAAANDYVGQFTLDGQSYPANARDAGSEIDGSFQAKGSQFTFTAKLQADTLILITGGKTYMLKPKAPANPLEASAASNNTAPQQPAAADTLANYTVVTRTDAGQALSGTRAGITSVRAALVATVNDLGHYFDAAPTVRGAYEDNQTHKNGGVIFTAALKGQPVRGMISTKLTDKGASVAVVYDRADAPADDWKKLTAAPAPAPGAAPAVADIALQTYNFSDGTGSIGIADGWQTNAQSEMKPVTIDGPNDSHVSMGNSFTILTPNSPLLNMRMAGGPPTIVIPFCEPVQALQALVPQLNAIRERNGGFSVRIDQILANTPVASPDNPNAKSAVIEYLTTKSDHGTITQHHNMANVLCTPLNQTSYIMWVAEITAPVDQFDKEKPVMLAMVNSRKENADVVNQYSAQQHQKQVDWFNGEQAAHQAQVSAFDRQQQAYHEREAANDQQHRDNDARENQVARGDDNYDELIRGERTVLDTTTGEKRSVDLLNVDGIVEGLNQAANDPNRFVQIPLRDEDDPLPGR